VRRVMRRKPHVNVTFYAGKSEWVSIAGIAKTTQDRAIVRKLYRKDWSMWSRRKSPSCTTYRKPRRVGVSRLSAPRPWRHACARRWPDALCSLEFRSHRTAIVRPRLDVTATPPGAMLRPRDPKLLSPPSFPRHGARAPASAVAELGS
jgi:hypothetical protein